MTDLSHERSLFISKPLVYLDKLSQDSSSKAPDSTIIYKEYIDRLFPNDECWSEVPELTSTSITASTIPPNSLVRFRGMIQDIYEPEYFQGYLDHQTENGQGYLHGFD